MYLKSIEVQGFKSFANKIVFQFHNGITGIVGPNGSGKSNVADAVRWVLGEQRVKELRGGSMQDIIFAGTENRKPLGSAYVAITLDNSDHQLPISYDEVTVARRLYRSGESEYLINGVACRLKDVNELFYDTGIGKEGYSIIGQGQIEKILNGKPEERRELFDEAAGIVKYKRRKLTAQKKLESEQQNLVRVNDILAELTRQLGPLERQAETAKIYLKKKEELKAYDVNMFLIEFHSIKENLASIQEKLKIAEDDLENTKKEYEKAREEYDVLERELEILGRELQEKQEQITQKRLYAQQMEGQIALLKEQINTAIQSDEHLQGRMTSLERDIAERERDLLQANEKQQQLLSRAKEVQEKKQQAENAHQEVQHRMEDCNVAIENGKNEIIRLLEERSSIKGKKQRYDTMLEQMNIRRAQLNQQVLKLKSEENDQNSVLGSLKADYQRVSAQISELNERSSQAGQELGEVQEKLSLANQQFESKQVEYHREASRLESLRNITERYDGYGNSIRRVMEQREKEKGIHGVVADLIKTEKKYEVAVETALGGSIQNIVTEDEETAKRMITYLKQNRFGRATFLPLTAMSGKGGFSQENVLKENGVIGLASTLVTADGKYGKLVEYLLGRTIVMDHIDHAVAVARKYRYSLRIVTLEGESLSPGGSMTGGAFKNSSNLLGRRREIEELQEQVKNRKNELEDLHQYIDECRTRRNQLREVLVRLRDQLQEKYLEQNTAGMKLKETENQKNQTISGYQQIRRENQEIEGQQKEIDVHSSRIRQELEDSEKRENELEAQVLDRQQELEQIREQEKAAAQHSERVRLELAAIQQEEAFEQQNRERISCEIAALQEEKETILGSIGDAAAQIKQKTAEISSVETVIKDAGEAEVRLRTEVEGLNIQKEEKNKIQKSFFQRREELSEQRARLDKECFRLNSQKEKQEEIMEARISYMWEEYELTYNMALKLKRDDLGSTAQIRKNIGTLKNEIKALGNVNVNAIEDFKELSERHSFLSTQHEDLIKAEAALQKIIAELDAGMRTQFKEQFVKIQTEFDKAFKQLFGGGKGTLELVEDEDILEAGIRIIAQPPGKKLQNMMQLSGGEKSLTAIALLFAIQNLKPSPFCLLDEIEAALDENNVERYAGYLSKLTKHTQFIIITHRRGTMAAADRLYGITMQEKGVSALVSVNLIEGELDK